MPSIDLTGDWVPIHLDPDDAVSIPITVPAGYESGTWEAAVYRDVRRGTPLVAFTVGVVGQVVTVSLTTLQVGALVTAGMSRFTGHWDLTRTATGAQRTFAKGSFVVDAGLQQPSNGTPALTLTVVDNEVTITAGIAATAVDLAVETAARVAADAAHTVDTTAVHGIADTALLATQSFVTAAVAALVAAAPGALDTLDELAAALGDDANFAATVTTALAGKQAGDADLTAFAGLVPANDDVVQRKAGVWVNRTVAQLLTDVLTAGLQATLNGKVNDTGDTITGDLTIAGTSKALRVARSGSTIEVEGTGADINLSVWSGTNFDGTLRPYLRLESTSPTAHIIGVVYFGTTGSDLGQFINPTTGVASLGAKNGLANIRLSGYRNSAGPPTTGAWTTDDQVIDVNGVWWRCTGSGTPGTWTQTTLAAAAVTNTPAGTIAATTVQAAINELDTEKVPVTPAWTAVAGGIGFANSWTNTGGGSTPAAYRLLGDGKHVEMVGQITGGASGATAFTLPAGYRPATTKVYLTCNNSAGSYVILIIDTTGTVQLLLGSAANNQCINCMFPIDA